MNKKTFTVLFTGALFYFYQFFLRNSPSVLGEYIIQDFSVSATMLGLFSAAYYIPYVLLQIPIGVIFDSFGTRKVMLIGSSLCALGVLLLSVSPFFSVTLIARFIIGAGASSSFTGPIKLNSSWVAPTSLAISLGLLSAFGKFGGAVSGVLLPSLIQYLGSWRKAFYIVGLFGILIVFFIYKFVQDSPSIKDSEIKSIKKKITLKESVNNLKIVAKSKNIWLFGIYSYCMHLPLSSFSDTWSSVYIKSVYFVSLQKASSMKSLILIGVCVGAPLFSYISDKMQNRIKCLKFASVLCFLSTACIILFPPKSCLIASFILFVMGFASSGQVLVYAMSTESSRKGFAGASNSIISMLTMSGGMLHSPLMGFLIDTSSNGNIPRIFDYRFAMTSMIIAVAFSCVIAFILPETFPKKECT